MLYIVPDVRLHIWSGKLPTRETVLFSTAILHSETDLFYAQGLLLPGKQSTPCKPPKLHKIGVRGRHEYNRTNDNDNVLILNSGNLCHTSTVRVTSKINFYIKELSVLQIQESKCSALPVCSKGPIVQTLLSVKRQLQLLQSIRATADHTLL